MELPLYIGALFFVVAFLYGSVGHGGASGYLAVLTLSGLFSPEFVPVVLLLNILVSATALYNYGSRGHFRWSLFWPFAVSSIPAAFMGGLVQLEAALFYITTGLVLIVMAGFIVFRSLYPGRAAAAKPVHIPLALLLGLGIGFLSGLIGVGGGIFLSPLILFLGWASIMQIAAVSALFILANSISGLLGHAVSTQIEWGTAFYLALPVLAGGFLGSRYGALTVSPGQIRVLLAIVLVIAGIKMLAQHAF